MHSLGRLDPTAVPPNCCAPTAPAPENAMHAVVLAVLDPTAGHKPQQLYTYYP